MEMMSYDLVLSESLVLTVIMVHIVSSYYSWMKLQRCIDSRQRVVREKDEMKSN